MEKEYEIEAVWYFDTDSHDVFWKCRYCGLVEGPWHYSVSADAWLIQHMITEHPASGIACNPTVDGSRPYVRERRDFR